MGASTRITSPDALSVARAIASRAFCCPAVSSLGADAFAEESVVEPSHPRQLRRSSTATTPRFSSERIVADRSPFMRLSSRVVTGPQESASMSWRWRTARSAGSNDRPSSVRLTHRAVTGVTAGGSYAYEPSSRRTTLPAPPGGNSRRRHSESGATYSRLIQNASSADAAENAGAATTSRTGLMRAGSRASAPGSSCSVSARATTYPASTRRPNGTSTVLPPGRHRQARRAPHTQRAPTAPAPGCRSPPRRTTKKLRRNGLRHSGPRSSLCHFSPGSSPKVQAN